MTEQNAFEQIETKKLIVNLRTQKAITCHRKPGLFSA
jgi:hypothetical protein